MNRAVGFLVLLALASLMTACESGMGEEGECGDNNAACAPADEEPEFAGHGCRDPENDLSKEPDYSVNYIHRWQDADGCDVRLDVLMTRQGADACGGAKVADILMGTPLGKTHDTTDGRIFIKDPQGVFGDNETTAGFDGNTQLPEGVADTGYRQDGAELWTGSDDRYIYLVYEDHNERWPQDLTPPGCA